jgi:hypothetical protein
MQLPSKKIGIIVEGHGEEQALPKLIRRILHQVEPAATVSAELRRIPKSKLIRPDELEKAVEALSRQIGRTNPIIVLADADDECPVELRDSLCNRCEIAHKDLNISIVIAQREYESWFIAAARSLIQKGYLTTSLMPLSNCESIGGAKEWLTKHMRSSGPYSPTRHQTLFSLVMDLEEARGARSFRKLEKEVRFLLTAEND